MFAIIGLGNPGEKYQQNRHNVGFMFVNYLVNELTGSRVNEFRFDKYSHSQFVNTLMENKKLLLVKPQTFMNRSGEAVKKIIQNWKLKIGNIVVAHDDLDIPLGKFKIQKGTGPQLHNGLESVEQYLKTSDFWRIRIGVDHRTPDNWPDGETYVLQNFLKDELVTMKNLFPTITNHPLFAGFLTG